MNTIKSGILRGFATAGLALGLMVSAPAAAFAQQAGAAKLSIELNTLSQQDSACRMIFLVKNAMGKDLERAVFETVLFKSDGSVDRLTLFDFQTLPAGRPRVRQFDISGTKCEALGRVLFNDVHVCTGEGITGSDCIDALELSTKTAVEVLG